MIPHVSGEIRFHGDVPTLRTPGGLLLVVVGLACLPQAPAQSGLPSFEVASLKAVVPSPPYPIDLGRFVHGRLTLTNVTLAECLRFAFNINNDTQIAGPDWIKSRDALFTIVGQAPPDTPKDQLRLMALNLLTERFRLAIHHEQRELPYFALVIDKKGSKLREAKDGTDNSESEVRQGRIVVHRASIETLIALLGRFTSRPIVDRTELKARYDIRLEWTPLNQNAPKQSDVAGAIEALPGPTMFEAIQEQLGLKLDLRKAPMEVIVVDRAEKTPLPN